MNNATLRRLTGISGVMIGVGATLLVPLYFTYSGAPPVWNVLTRNLLNLILCALLIVFIAGFCHLIRQADAAYEAVGSIVYGAGLTYVAATLVATSLEVGAILGTPDGTLDPTIDGPLAHGSILLHGSIARILTAVFLGAAGYAIRRTRSLPGWAGRTAHGIALFNLAFVPSLCWGTDPAQFYSAIGWGNTAFAAVFLPYWMLAVGIAMIRQPRIDSAGVEAKVCSGACTATTRCGTSRSSAVLVRPLIHEGRKTCGSTRARRSSVFRKLSSATASSR
jgi:hypothetical protein